MTAAEYIRHVAQIAVLKEASKEIHKTIDNIIVELESRKKEVENAN